MRDKPYIGIVIGSTRPTRFADVPAKWMLQQVNKRNDIEADIVDIRDYDLPFFDEAESDMWAESKNPNALRWQEKIRNYDGYIFVVGEYNRSIPGALKNALDQAYKGWSRKTFSAIGYSGTGAARAIEHLRLICIELQMIPTRSAIHIGGGDIMKIHPKFGNKPIEEIENNLVPYATQVIDELVWLSNAMMAAKRQET